MSSKRWLIGGRWLLTQLAQLEGHFTIFAIGEASQIKGLDGTGA
jgi:hypothetical protein